MRRIDIEIRKAASAVQLMSGPYFCPPALSPAGPDDARPEGSKDRQLSAWGTAPPAFFGMLGVGKVMLKEEYDLEPLLNLCEQLMPHMPKKWSFFQTPEVLTILKSFFAHCKSIEFCDQQRVIENQQIWKGIMLGIIRPMGSSAPAFLHACAAPAGESQSSNSF